MERDIILLWEFHFGKIIIKFLSVLNFSSFILDKYKEDSVTEDIL